MKNETIRETVIKEENRSNAGAKSTYIANYFSEAKNQM